VAASAARPPRRAYGGSVSTGEFRGEFITGIMTGSHHRNPLPESV
jgi:hypothetical protein